MTKKRLFAVSVLSTTCVTLVVLYRHRPPSRPIPLPLDNSESVYVSSQLQPEDVRSMRQDGMQTIIDLRPDGEAPDEPIHLLIAQAAQASGLDFTYIPVPHERIPPASVSALGSFLATARKPALLYCRTGRRAVRTFALFQASRPAGPGVDAILGMARNAGFSADDLRGEILNRIAARASVPETKP